ncbi:MULTISPECIES: hypothetical protein [Streptomyces]|uniref:hypothetical protein n=1 Tax=Streptomyces TaxID=1883 RepID=UPI00278C7085|nr:hypothetical protein [Streptomyces hydrogenans]
MEEPEITIKLTLDEATILSDWWDRLQMTGPSDTVDDPAAWAPIHRIAGQRNKMLPALFFPDHDVRLEEARRRLRQLGPGLAARPGRTRPPRRSSGSGVCIVSDGP